MQTYTMNTVVEELKSRNAFFAAGAVAAQTGQARAYGCHFGMRSERNKAQTEFFAGFDAAQKAD